MRKIIVFLMAVALIQGIRAQDSWIFMPTIGLNFIPVDEGSVSGLNYKPAFAIGCMASNFLEDNITQAIKSLFYFCAMHAFY